MSARVELVERLHPDAGLEPRAGASSSDDHRAADRAPIRPRRPASRSDARPCRGRRRSPRTSASRTGGRRARRRRRTAPGPRAVDQRRASTAAGSAEYRPNRASLTGCSGTWSIGRRKSAVMSSKRSASGPNTDRQRRPSARRAPRRSRRPIGTPRRRAPPSSGWAYWTSGQRQRQPMAAQVEAADERGVDRQRVGRRALVVEQAGERQLASCGCRRRASSAASSTVHLDAFGGEGERGSEPVGPAADDDRAGHAVTGPGPAGPGEPAQTDRRRAGS